MRQLDNKKLVINYDKLITFGFVKEDNEYNYKENILNNDFTVVINITNDKITSKVIDNNTNLEYLLVDVLDAVGSYIGSIRDSYDKVISKFTSECCFKKVFSGFKTNQIINYVKDKYHDELEFLWEKYDDCAVVRNKDNKKWYLLFMVVGGSKLNDDDNKQVEIIDLMYYKDKLVNIIDNKRIYPGYHMNKKSWITVRLDSCIDINYIYELIDISYEISLKK